METEGDAEQAELQDAQEDEEFRQRVIQQLDHLCQCVQSLIDSDSEYSQQQRANLLVRKEIL